MRGTGAGGASKREQHKLPREASPALAARLRVVAGEAHVAHAQHQRADGQRPAAVGAGGDGARAALRGSGSGDGGGWSGGMRHTRSALQCRRRRLCRERAHPYHTHPLSYTLLHAIDEAGEEHKCIVLRSHLALPHLCGVGRGAWWEGAWAELRQARRSPTALPRAAAAAALRCGACPAALPCRAAACAHFWRMAMARSGASLRRPEERPETSSARTGGGGVQGLHHQVLMGGGRLS